MTHTICTLPFLLHTTLCFAFLYIMHILFPFPTYNAYYIQSIVYNTYSIYSIHTV